MLFLRNRNIGVQTGFTYRRAPQRFKDDVHPFDHSAGRNLRDISYKYISKRAGSKYMGVLFFGDISVPRPYLLPNGLAPIGGDFACGDPCR